MSAFFHKFCRGVHFLLTRRYRQKFTFGMKILKYLILPKSDVSKLPKKNIVILVSTMRSGSTLLKSLLASAPDVSCLPETDYRDYFFNDDYFYREASKISSERIILIKSVTWLNEGKFRRRFPCHENVKVIIIVRDVYNVVISLMNRKNVIQYKMMTKQDFIDYWCSSNESLIESSRDLNHGFRLVKYEELLKKPIIVTKELFDFIGSQRQEGTDTYQKPASFEWRHGNDDGGDKIKSLKVQPDSGNDKLDEELIKLINASDRVRRVREVLGYQQGDGKC